MPRRSKANTKRWWKMERASVHKKRQPKARSNKYSGGDTEAKPKKHKRKQVWVGGYKKRNGTSVKGYYRTNAQYRG